jgi:hypothetical protein
MTNLEPPPNPSSPRKRGTRIKLAVFLVAKLLIRSLDFRSQALAFEAAFLVRRFSGHLWPGKAIAEINCLLFPV